MAAANSRIDACARSRGQNSELKAQDEEGNVAQRCGNSHVCIAGIPDPAARYITKTSTVEQEHSAPRHDRSRSPPVQTVENSMALADHYLLTLAPHLQWSLQHTAALALPPPLPAILVYVGSPTCRVSAVVQLPAAR